MTLSAEQMAFRAAREAREGESVFLGSGLAAGVRRYLRPGVRIVEKESGPASVDVAFLSAKKICCRGDLIFSARSNTRTHCDWSTVPDCEANRIVVLIPHTANGKANIVEHRAKHGSGKVDQRQRRIITDLALMDVTDKGLVLRELAPGVNAREVQNLTGTLLLVGADLTEMEVSE
jgi:acyl CoA:acetate/3-ketoacid CoA transferase beta subunit